MKNSILAIIKHRRTIRTFNNRKVTKNVLKNILEAGRWAPCPNNVQPWIFYVTKRNNFYTQKIIKIIQKESKNESIGVSVFLNDSIKIFKSAPIMIYIFKKCILAKRYAVLGPSYQQKGELFEHQAISAAIENMILCAEAYGIGSVWLGSPVFLSKKIEAIFKIDDELCAVIGLGYYDKKPAKIKKIPFSQIVKFL
ncbi:MAG: nitroreductase family protein [Candidatus Omnitrophica bacterium]|nr:nitroreductase family protein [Candidatus Omnitrophota bacterium]